jgi:hypothetical protein
MLIVSPVSVSGIYSPSGYTDDTVGETATRYFDKEFRYSLDQGATYSTWQDLTSLNLSTLELTAQQGILFEFRYTRAGADATGVLEFNSIELLGAFSDSFLDQLKRATQLLYPTGRAFKTPKGGIRQKVQDALTKSEDRALADAQAILYSILPDNDRFSEDNATEWEKRLGIPNGADLTLEIRKENILRKLRHPGTIPARQNYLYLQAQLRAAGFDVYVHENRFAKSGGGFEARPYIQVVGPQGQAVHSPLVQHGTIQHGGSNIDMVVNSTEKSTDQGFNLNGNYERTFFVGGLAVGSTAEIDASREKEFRQMILQIKPVHTVAFLLIEYT